MRLAAVFAEEGHHHGPRHVEGRQTGREHSQPVEPDIHAVDGDEDLVFGLPAGKEWHAGDGGPGRAHGPEGERNLLPQAAHMAHILLTRERVNHRARAEEEQRLEERVRADVEDGRLVGARATGHEHIAKLRNGGVGEHLLDVELCHADGGGDESGEAAGGHHHGSRRVRAVKDRAAAGRHVDAGRHHGGGVDQCRHGRGAGHGVRQPDVKRNLRGLAASADKEQQRNRFQHPALLRGRLRHHGGKGQRAKVDKDQKHGQGESEIANAVDDESLVGCVSGELLFEVETDQQIGAEPHSFPPHKHQQEVVGQHQHQHKEHEEVEVAEEAVVAALMFHVGSGVDMDEQAHARHNPEHHGG